MFHYTIKSISTCLQFCKTRSLYIRRSVFWSNTGTYSYILFIFVLWKPILYISQSSRGRGMAFEDPDFEKEIRTWLMDVSSPGRAPWRWPAPSWRWWRPPRGSGSQGISPSISTSVYEWKKIFFFFAPGAVKYDYSFERHVAQKGAFYTGFIRNGSLRTISFEL